jgi:hypothetical protein
MIELCVTLLELLGGARPMAPRTLAQCLGLGLWWLTLLLFTLLFAGRYSKFVYVDF